MTIPFTNPSLTSLNNKDTQQNDLWNIIEKQRVIIHELQKALNNITRERDDLLVKITTFENNNNNNMTDQKSSTTSSSSSTDSNKSNGGTTPTLPPRSPYRSNNLSSQEDTTNKLKVLQIKIISTNVTSFVISILNSAGQELWHIEKLYIDFINLIDDKLLSIPLEQRQLFLEAYFKTLIQSKPQHELGFLYSFITPLPHSHKGYLFKREKQGWKQYYFILLPESSELKYFDASIERKHDGQIYLGTLSLTSETQISKKQSLDTTTNDFIKKSLQYAFTILTPHHSIVLSTKSDSEQEKWMKSLSDIVKPPLMPYRSHSNPSFRQSVDEQAIFKYYETSDEYENKKKKKEKRRKTFWFSKPVANKHVFKVFGITLEEAIRECSLMQLPAIVYRCLAYLDAQGAAYEEGIYRLSGSSVQVDQLRQTFCEQGDVDLLKYDSDLDVHVVAGLLKLWLRELPTNILTNELLDQFLAAVDIKSKSSRIKQLKYLVAMLPKSNYVLLNSLLSHLLGIAQRADHNKMTVRNMGIVFAPTLSIPSTIFTLFMNEFKVIFCNDHHQKESRASHISLPDSTTLADRVKFEYLLKIENEKTKK
ncbi:uncharacterized protein BX663DRAFT_548511 [Cokeromyces recurvatus]|uniref:uncharacterized protein n=1 Tax=Cokeromyces recurvatus TaxID=90255 RepID=UPI00221F7123|nr:uncharacterized protein BX663DRAFT_548511 [Cokeromyces recurvatus]KAI7906315.1 hypothetical protein BX663DRAFT_548511 [Cokeromyces recurvatus]